LKGVIIPQFWITQNFLKFSKKYFLSEKSKKFKIQKKIFLAIIKWGKIYNWLGNHKDKQFRGLTKENKEKGLKLVMTA